MMPLEWMRAVRDAEPRYSPRRLLALWALALRMRPDGTGWASGRQLAADAGCSSDTVERATTDARRRGHLDRTRRGHRVTDTTVLASEWRLAEVQTRTRAVLDTDPNPQNVGPKPAAIAAPRGLSPRGLSLTRAGARARELLAEAGAAEDEMDEILDLIKIRHPRIRHLNGWLATAAGNNSLAEIIDSLRGESRRSRVAKVIANAKHDPPCEHGTPGGATLHPASRQPLCALCRAAAPAAVTP